MENLRQLMAAYFHQDWSEEYDGSWEVAVDDFMRREPSRVAHTRAEIATLLGDTDDDGELGRALEALGNYYWPGEGTEPHRQWLVQVESRLSTPTA